jgi:hypothetical protein
MGVVVRAIREGIARARSAPAIVVGTLAATLVFSIPPDLSSRTVLFSHYLAFASTMPHLTLAPAMVTGSAGAPGTAILVQLWSLIARPGWLVLWAFLSGGILDRYARNRPTRSRGFFGACGAHFPAMLRLGLGELLLDLLVVFVILAVTRGQEPLSAAVVILALLAGNVLVIYARVRLVVEDRRSAIGAVLASARFVRRNAIAACSLYVVFAACLILAWVFLETRLSPDWPRPGWATLAGGEITMAALMFVALALLASCTALFQARLAHASYTAAPTIEWPESPAAEAIANATPTLTP